VFCKVKAEYAYGHMCTDKRGVRLELKLQHNETWSAAAWPTRRLRYRPPVFFCHSRLIASWSPPKEKCSAFQKYYCFNLFFTFENSGNLQLKKPYLELSWFEECLYLWDRTVGAWSWQFLYISLRDCILFRTLLRCVFLFICRGTTELHSGTQVMLTW